MERGRGKKGSKDEMERKCREDAARGRENASGGGREVRKNERDN